MRLHFFAFSSAINLFKAVSDVSTSDYKYSVYFRPQESSFAFASAIEAFPVDPLPLKINVGGPMITQENDNLGRNWIPGAVPVVNGPKKKQFMVVVGSVLACSVLICILEIQKPDEFPLALDWCLLHVHEGGGSYRGVPEGTGFPMHNVNFGLKITYVEINNGKGVFGNVYRGTLRNSMKVAVKRGETGSGQALPEFQTAIIVL
ncbi:hypothetical protein KPL70_019793 [Citrus sinensis]|nr:hypothetical protein KPL70_019793 [Citrus sinensis]